MDRTSGGGLPHRDLMFPVEVKGITFKEYRITIVRAAEAFTVSSSRKPSVQAEIAVKLLDRGAEARAEGQYDEAFFRYMRGLYVIAEGDMLHHVDEELQPHLTRALLRQKMREANDAVEALSNTELVVLFNDAVAAFEEQEMARSRRIEGQLSEEGRELDEDEQQAAFGEEEASRRLHEERRQAVLAKQFKPGPTIATAAGGSAALTAGGTAVSLASARGVVADQAQLARVLGTIPPNGSSAVAPPSQQPALDAKTAHLMEIQKRLGMQVTPPPQPPTPPLVVSPTPPHQQTGPGKTAVPAVQPQRQPDLDAEARTAELMGLEKQLNMHAMPESPIPTLPQQPASSPKPSTASEALPPPPPAAPAMSCFLTFPNAIRARHFVNPYKEWAYATTFRQPNSQTPTPLRRGLRNLGNTCYMNSVLQCMASVPQLEHYFSGSDAWLEDTPTANPNLHSPAIVKIISRGTKVVETFALVMENLKRLVVPASVQAFNPAPLKYTMGEVNENFSGFQQQDANEFFLSLLNALHDGLNKRIAIPPSPAEAINNSIPSTASSNDASAAVDAQQALHHMQQYLRRNSPRSIILKAFQFQTKSVTRCHECLGVSTNFGVELALEVPVSPPTPDPTSGMVANSTTPVALEQCIQSFSELGRFKFNPKEVDNSTGKNISGYLCAKCNRRVDATRQTQIYSLPNNLVITLKRFKSNANFSEKVSTPVSVPEILDMAPFCSSSTSNSIVGPASASSTVMAVSAPMLLHRASAELEGETSNSGAIVPTTGTRYRLVGVVNHRGNCNGGHYTSDVRSRVTSPPPGGDVWSSCSDDSVTPGTKPSRALAYMLFYTLE